jgi:hypothetical protein
MSWCILMWSRRWRPWRWCRCFWRRPSRTDKRCVREQVGWRCVHAREQEVTSTFWANVIHNIGAACYLPKYIFCFRASVVRGGRRVRLKDDRWEHHICRLFLNVPFDNPSLSNQVMQASFETSLSLKVFELQSFLCCKRRRTST